MERRALLLAGLIAWTTQGIASDLPRPEHPEPMATRPHWSNLNGTWQFRFDPDDMGIRGEWYRADAPGFDQTIVVPFPWESPLSGIGQAKGAPRIGWYRRTFRVPNSFPKGHRVWLHFQAVDWHADVWVNGRKIAKHDGGYTPFSVDVTDALTRNGDNSLVVRAFDPTDPNLPTGKQIGWYTTTSGIWQTVWLEARPTTHIQTFTIQTDLDPARVRVRATLSGTQPGKSYHLNLTVPPDGSGWTAAGFVEARGETTEVSLEVRVPQDRVRLWTPETPHLYDAELTLLDAQANPIDSVGTYFGLRTIGRGKLPGEDFERVFLNGKPVYLRGALDQSFNPQGIYTAPSDEFLKKDIELAKACGLNFLRIHIKSEEPRRLYWADQLGLLIMQDMPNTWRQNETARAAWESTMRETVVRDRNHPSIFSWIAFNETWGLSRGNPRGRGDYKEDQDTQEWVKRMMAEIRRLDPTRLVEDNSPCNYDHVEGTDFNSWHFYIDDHEQAKQHIDEVVARSVPGSGFNYCPGQTMNSAPLINSEYGAVSAGGGDRDISWGFRDLTTLLRKQPRIQGYVYTELTDIEWEHNGFADYDRSAKAYGYDAFVPGMTVKDLQAADFVGYEGPPVLVTRPGQTVPIPWFVSHYSERDEPPTLRWWVTGFDEMGQPIPIKSNHRAVVWSPYAVTPQTEPLTFSHNGPFVGAVAMELVDRNGKRLAANFVNVVVRSESPPPRWNAGGTEARLSFAPEAFSRRQWDAIPTREPTGKAQGLGKGFFEFRLKVPTPVVQAGPKRLELLIEASARAGREQVDWAERVNPLDNPQTDHRTWPSEVLVSLNGRPLGRVPLADDPADGRGVLSHLARADHGSFGEFIQLAVEGTDAAAIAGDLQAGKPLVLRLEVPADSPHPGGLALFGATTGRFPFDPTVRIQTSRPLPADLAPQEPVAVDTLASRVTHPLRTGDSGEAEASTIWAYTTEEPPVDWVKPDFNDSAWKRGRGGFGQRGTPGIEIGTAWTTPWIWLRSRADLPSLTAEDSLTLHLFHDEDVEIFVNGQILLRQTGYRTAYSDFPLTRQQVAMFREGPNTMAVRCRQTSGGQGVDVGLRLVRRGE
jgi:hypothetical protein